MPLAYVLATGVRMVQSPRDRVQVVCSSATAVTEDQKNGEEQSTEHSDNRQPSTCSAPTSTNLQPSRLVAVGSPRSRSDSSASSSSYYQRGCRDDTEVMSALSVEVAVVVDEGRSPPLLSRRPSRRRSFSGLSSNDTAGSRIGEDYVERRREMTMAATPAIDSPAVPPPHLDPESEGGRPPVHAPQSVIRVQRHRRSTTVPTLMELFDVTPTRNTGSTHSLTSEDAKLSDDVESLKSFNGIVDEAPVFQGEGKSGSSGMPLPDETVRNLREEESPWHRRLRSPGFDPAQRQQQQQQQPEEEQEKPGGSSPWNRLSRNVASRSSLDEGQDITGGNGRVFPVPGLAIQGVDSDITGLVGQTDGSQAREEAAVVGSDLRLSERFGETFGTLVSTSGSELRSQFPAEDTRTRAEVSSSKKLFSVRSLYILEML